MACLSLRRSIAPSLHRSVAPSLRRSVGLPRLSPIRPLRPLRLLATTAGQDALLTLNQDGRFEESYAATLFVQMLRAVQYCHNHGVCHRDVKLDNFVFKDDSPNAPLLLIDFGLGARFGPYGRGRNRTHASPVARRFGTHE